MSDPIIADTYVVVIGGSNVDIAGKPDGDLVRANSNPGRVSFSSGGVARNVAEGLARLGKNVTLLTVVGDDTFGQQLLDGCVAAGIDVSRSLTSQRFPTSVYLSLLTREGDLDAAVSDMQIVTELNPAFVEKNRRTINGASLIVADTNLNRATLEALLCGDIGSPVLVDGVSANKVVRLAGLLDRIEILKLNRLEAEVLTGIDLSDTESTSRALDQLLDQGVGRVFLTLGAGGMVWGDSRHGAGAVRGEVPLPAMDLDIVNANGAGDMCTAALAFSFLQQDGPNDSAQFAVAASMLALQVAGTMPTQLTPSTVRETMSEMGFV